MKLRRGLALQPLMGIKMPKGCLGGLYAVLM